MTRYVWRVSSDDKCLSMELGAGWQDGRVGCVGTLGVAASSTYIGLFLEKI